MKNTVKLYDYNTIIFVCLLCFTILFCFVSDLTSAEVSSSESRLDIESRELDKLKDTINKQIEKIQTREYRRLKYLKDFTEIEFAIALKRKNLLLAELMSEKLDNDIHTTQAEIGKLKLSMNQKRTYTEKRLVDLYKVSRQPLLAIILNRESLPDLYRQLEYLKILLKRDHQYAREYENIVQFWMERKKTLEDVKMRAVVHGQEIWPQKEGLKTDLEQRKTFISELKQNPGNYSKFLREIQKCRNTLDKEVTQMKCREEPSNLEKHISAKDLLIPVDIKLLKNKWNRWIKENFHPAGGGLEFFLPEGSEIHAVGTGTVCFSDWFIGFGNTIVIDHGDGWKSVYAHCSSLLVEKGDRVGDGELIGYVGDSSSLRGFTLYFELRHDNMLIPPLESFGIKF